MKQHIGTGEHESVRERIEASTFISFHKLKPLVIVNREDFTSIAPRSEYLNLKWPLHSLFITKERIMKILLIPIALLGLGGYFQNSDTSIVVSR